MINFRVIRGISLAIFATLAVLIAAALYPPSVGAQVSDDAKLSGLTVSPRNIIGFTADRTSYEVGVASTVTQATITATKRNSGAVVAYSGTDADNTTDGHQVDLSAGRNRVTVTVTAADTTTTKTYRVRVNRGVTDFYGWKAALDLDGLIAAGNEYPDGIWSDRTTMWVTHSADDKLYAYNTDGTRDNAKDFDALGAAGNIDPSGIWSNGTTMWVADLTDEKLYAYNTDGTRDSAEDFDTLKAAGNRNPGGIWSDGMTMWVASPTNDKIYAYRMSDKSRDSAKDFDTLSAASNTSPGGIWSDRTTMWVADSSDEKIYAYRLSDQTRNSGKDFDTLSAAGNKDPYGIWSDETTMWVADSSDDKIYAYRMSDTDRDSGKDFGTLSAALNTDLGGIWSDGTTMWVADFSDDKLYAYNMPGSTDDATLSGLTVSPRDIIGFEADRTTYEVGVASTVTQASITATTNHPGATVAYSRTDRDPNTAGLQFNLSAGRNAVTVTVTAADTTTTGTYTVSVNRGVTDVYGWKAALDLDGLIAAGNATPYGIWSDGTTAWVADSTDDKLYAYNTDGTRDSAKDFDTLVAAGNNSPRGIWSDGTTMWVVDSGDDKLYGYRMSDKGRDSGKDFDTLSAAGNNDPIGIWSDGTTMWVGDWLDAKIYAYRMSDKARDSGKDFDTLSTAGNTRPLGIWSDGTTLWVVDVTDDKVYAYRMSGKARDSAKDFDTLSAVGNNDPIGIWSDGTTMWVVDSGDGKVYSYNMPPGVTVSPTSLTINEGGTGTYTVVLNTQPVGGSGRVTVTAAVTDPANPSDQVASVSPGQRVFTTGNWNIAQTFTVTAAADLTDPVAHTISHTVSGADYGSVAAADVMVTLTDSIVDVDAAIDLTGSDADYSSPGSASGVIETPSEVDWVRVKMFATRRYRFELSLEHDQDPSLGAAWDMEIEGVYNAAGVKLAGPGASGPDAAEWRTPWNTDWFRLDRYGDYYVAVAIKDDGDNVGGWEMEVYHRPLKMPQESPEALASLRSPARVDVGGCFVGALEPSRENDIDWIGVQVTAGERYLIEVRAWESGLGSLIDVDLKDARFDPSNTAIAAVYGEDGKLLMPDSPDEGEGQEERIIWTPAVSGLYFLEVLTPGGFNGSYVVSVSHSVDGSVDCGPATAMAVAQALAGPGDPPARPQGLTGTVEHDVVSLTWDDPGDAGITGYQILRLDRKVHGLGNFQVHVDDTGTADTLYVDTGVAPETRYVYRIKARNAAGLSNRSFYFDADTPAAPDPALNNPATGAPTIIGTAQVGEKLLADTSGIGDADGLDDAVFSYQWIISLGAGSAHIPGATDATYTPAASDEGVAIRVRVSFADDAGNDESLTSAATEAVMAKSNSPTTGAPAISGVAEVGETVTADTTGIEDADGLDNASFNYRWLADDAEIQGATNSSYTLVGSDEGMAIKVRVSFTDDAGNEETLTSAATAAVAAAETMQAEPPAKPTGLTGTVAHDVVSLTWNDPGDGSITGYQILRRDRDTSAIGVFEVLVEDTGSAATSYVDRDVTPETRYNYRVKARNAAGLSQRSNYFKANIPADPEPGPNGPATGAPAITGTAQVGETLTADTSGIADSDGLDNAVFSYQWIANDGTTDTDIPGATGWTYTPVAEDEGKTIRVRVSFTDDAGNEETLTSATSAVVEAKPNSPATGVPTIGGTAQVGDTLTADTSDIEDADGLNNSTFSYQWLADDIEITGATSSTYTLTPDDEGKSIKVRGSFTDDAGNEESLTSGATVAVMAAEPEPNSPATGAPVISGTVQVGETLTADTSGIADADGLANATFSYQWIANDGTTDADISSATDPTYTLVTADEDKTVKVRVSFADDGGNEESLTSGATVAVMAAEPEPEPEEPPAMPTGLTGTVAHDAVSLTWDDPEDASITGYQILRRNPAVDAPGQFQVHVEDTGSAATTYVDRDVEPDTRYVYRIKARSAAGLSERSDYFRADTPPEPEPEPEPNSPATGSPVILGTAQVGETLTADTSGIGDSDGLDTATFSYQWIVSDGGADLDIPGATGAAYTLIPIDAGLVVMVRVSFTDDAGNEETLTSAATAVVAEEQ